MSTNDMYQRIIGEEERIDQRMRSVVCMIADKAMVVLGLSKSIDLDK
jgi:hypothetical protein